MTIQHTDRMRQRDPLLTAVVSAPETVKRGSPPAFAGWESSTSTHSKTETNRRCTVGTRAALPVPVTTKIEAVHPNTSAENNSMAVDSPSEDVRSGSPLVNRNEEEKNEDRPFESIKLQHLIKEEPLKYNAALAEETLEDQQTLLEEAPVIKRQKTGNTESSNSTRRRRKRCVFNETVRVIPIPLRTEYSNRVRDRIWSNSVEIQENAARNTIEFASEGWDWRAVLLDEAMHHCTTTGELIHPIHYEPHTFLQDANAADASSCSSSDDSSSNSSFSSTTSLETTSFKNTED